MRHTPSAPRSALSPRHAPATDSGLNLWQSFSFWFSLFLRFFLFRGNSNCRWADETMTIEMAMKLPMRERGRGRAAAEWPVESWRLRGGLSIDFYLCFMERKMIGPQRKATIDTSQKTAMQRNE